MLLGLKPSGSLRSLLPYAIFGKSKQTADIPSSVTSFQPFLRSHSLDKPQHYTGLAWRAFPDELLAMVVSEQVVQADWGAVLHTYE